MILELVSENDLAFHLIAISARTSPNLELERLTG